MIDNLHNPSNIIDIQSIVNQIKQNTKLLKTVTSVSSSVNFVKQFKPKMNQLPALGVTVECGSISENFSNSSMAQTMDVVYACTLILDTTPDLTGALSQNQMFSSLLSDVMHAIYNWQPRKDLRYQNGIKMDRFERIDNLCDNTYEVYILYFSVPVQIDYLDGFLTDPQKLLLLNTQINLEKSNTITTVNIINEN